MGEHSHTRIQSDGTRGPNIGRNWQTGRNLIRQAVGFAIAPKVCSIDWEVELDDQFNPTLAGGSPMHLCRWAMATTLLDDGVFSLNGTTVGGSEYKAAALLDEPGLINAPTTGLSKHWLGAAIDAFQVTPVQGTNIWIREFTNGLVVVNSGNDPAGAATTVLIGSIPGGAGTFKRIDGLQDPGVNDGSTVNGGFSLNQVDALILERI